MCSFQLIRESEHAQKCVLFLNVFTSPINPLKGQLMPLQHFLIKLKTLGWETVFTLSVVAVLGFCSSDRSCPKWICCFSCERIFLRCSKDKLCTQFETPRVQCKNLLHKCR